MKNDEVLIHIESVDGKKIYQTFFKEKDAWLMRSSTSNIFECTAEQVLNHLIPALFDGKGGKIKVRVEKR